MCLPPVAPRRLPTADQPRYGGHQEEDAGHEGGEGQRLRQGGCLRGAVQGRQGKLLVLLYSVTH